MSVMPDHVWPAGCHIPGTCLQIKLLQADRCIDTEYTWINTPIITKLANHLINFSQDIGSLTLFLFYLTVMVLRNVFLSIAILIHPSPTRNTVIFLDNLKSGLVRHEFQEWHLIGFQHLDYGNQHLRLYRTVCRGYGINYYPVTKLIIFPEAVFAA